MRVRRVALVAVLALLAGSSLTGCRSEPAVAAYLGDRKVTVDELNEIVAAVNDVADERTALIARMRAEQVAFSTTAKPGDTPPQVDPDALKPVTRTNSREVLSLLVCAEVGRTVIDEQSLAAAATPPEVFGGLFGLQASDRYVRLWGDYWTVYRAIGKRSKPQPVTDEQAEVFYDAMLAAGQVQGDADAAIGTIKSDATVGAVFQTQRVFDDAARRAGVRLNPRYGQLVLPLAVENSSSPIELPFPDNSGVPVEAA